MGDEFPVVRVAAVHAAAEFLNREASVDKACALIEEAGRHGAQLVAFPETFLPGYPYWIWSHTPAQGAPLFAELYANAVELPGPACERIGQAARQAGVWVVMGLNERDGGPSTTRRPTSMIRGVYSGGIVSSSPPTPSARSGGVVMAVMSSSSTPRMDASAG